MVFSSHLFVFYFLPLVLLGYHLLPLRGKHVFLTAVSYVFYGWANPWFVLLMMFQTVVDWVCGMTLAGLWRHPVGAAVPLLEPKGPRTGGQKAALAAAVISNLLLLAFFKYFNFGLDNWNAAMTALGWDAARWDTVLRITLPLGISFYTFQSMSYAIDVYRGQARAIRSILDYMCYVAMFPQLVAGPIVRFQDVADQFLARSHTLEKFARGVSFFALGLGKKILLANPCGKVADTVFGAGAAGTLEAWYGAAAYAFQIYFDFSAYSDMAIGLGLMLGWVFAKNFDSPYQSRSLTEFWRRWHLSLSTWLRDNLYIPLGGNRLGEARTYGNLAITMLLGGLWHGASWNFVIWGGLHGGLLALERLQGDHAWTRRLPAPLQTALTFVFVLFTWVFFRATDLPSALHYCQAMLGFGPQQPGQDLLAGLIYQPYYLLSFAAAAGVVWGAPQTWDFTRRLTWPKAAFCAVILLLALAVMETQAFNPFIYFIF
ncbi:MAG: Peptidoglycan O-acetyltransferase [Verrucomicrobiota bacterium]|jgi:alginate O-acetyltransferase complex protein AlgI